MLAVYYSDMNKTFFTTITPFSKALALSILVIGPFAGFYLGTKYHKLTASTSEKIPTNVVELQTKELNTVENPAPKNDEDIQTQYTNSEYRVLKVLKNPDSSSYLIVATEKSKAECGSPEMPSRCINDTGCGGMYVSPTCYFFEEPGFVYGVNPNSRFIGTYEGYAVDLESLKFEDNKLLFTAGFGDAGYGVITENSLDLKNGTLIQLSKEEFQADSLEE